MKTLNIDKRMKDEIKTRLESRSWDFIIASKVIEKKKKKKFYFYFASLSSLAAAALVVIALIFSIGTSPVKPVYSNFLAEQLSGTHEAVFIESSTRTNLSKEVGFVQLQIKGTYSAAFRKEDTDSKGTNNLEMILASDVDSMIDNTMSNR